MLKRQPDELINKTFARTNICAGLVTLYHHICVINTILIVHVFFLKYHSYCQYFHSVLQIECSTNIYLLCHNLTFCLYWGQTKRIFCETINTTNKIVSETMNVYVIIHRLEVRVGSSQPCLKSNGALLNKMHNLMDFGGKTNS